MTLDAKRVSSAAMADYAHANPPYGLFGMIGIPLTYFLERPFARIGAHASLPRRALLQNVGLGVLVFSALSSGATALAADKTSIELACGGAKATITCQKFKEEACVASQLTFDTKDGVHVVSTYEPQQNFTVPTIADGLQCEAGIHDASHRFVVWYMPSGCPAAQCFTIKYFDTTGRKFTSKEERAMDRATAGPLNTLPGNRK